MGHKAVFRVSREEFFGGTVEFSIPTLPSVERINRSKPKEDEKGQGEAFKDRYKTKQWANQKDCSDTCISRAEEA